MPIYYFILFLIVCIIYFLPTIIALKAKHKQHLAICILNIALGWTVVGWVGALIWAVIEPTKP